jgi:hypothetical protein
MNIAGAHSTAVHAVVSGPVEPADWLGVCDSALYLLTRRGTVLAVLTRDAVRLPCAVVLAPTSAQLSLAATAPAPAHPQRQPTVGGGRVCWLGPGGPVMVACARQWEPPRALPGTADRHALDWLRRVLAGRDIGLEMDRVRALAQANGPDEQALAAAGLLGRGPGLTPSGDDVLAGFLLGALAFGRCADGVLRIVEEQAARATTALSAQLLTQAVEGYCVPELATVLAASSGRPVPPNAIARLLAVGHTSGAALAHGVVAAASAPAPMSLATVGADLAGVGGRVQPGTTIRSAG